MSDKEKKAQYDAYGDDMFGGQNFHDFARGQGGGVDINDILRQMFSQGGGFGGAGFGGQGGFGGGSPFGSGSPFGGGFAPDLDIQANLTIDFITAVLGGKKSITLNN